MKSIRLPALVFVGVLSLAPAFAAEPITGRASVVDGDTLDISGTRIRLHGIDAPESGQLCHRRAGEALRCGQAACTSRWPTATGHRERPLPGQEEHAPERRLSILHTARRTIQGFEAMLWLRKGFGFAGVWTVREQNQLLGVCFGLQAVSKI